MNPHHTNNQTGASGSNIVGLESARVITAPSNLEDDNAAHHIEVRPEMFDQPVVADVMVDQPGDVTIPTEGSRVIIGYRTNDRPIILGSRYGPNSDIPNYEAGERVIGHPLSDAYVKLASDGTVHIEGDADVVINGGSTRPVTDVETTTDNDGNVTDVTLSRADNMYLPSGSD